MDFIPAPLVKKWNVGKLANLISAPSWPEIGKLSVFSGQEGRLDGFLRVSFSFFASIGGGINTDSRG